MAEFEIHLNVNGALRTIKTEPCKTLLALLRKDLGLYGVKEGCGQGDCGTCVVVMDGQAVNACLVLAAQAEGSEILTIEGLARKDVLHPLQHQFAENWAFQCGYCTSGMLMSSYSLLLHNPDPTDSEIREAIEGNLCRCTSYRAIVDAVQASADQQRNQRSNLAYPNKEVRHE